MIKFISSTFLILLFIGIAYSDDFSSVSSNNGFIPSADLRGIYSQQGAAQNGGGYHKAQIYFKTKMPSLNPDQSGVSKVVCDGDKITLNLSDDNNSIDQVNSWPDQVILLISDNWKCFGKTGTQFYTVGNKVVDVPNKSVTFTSKDCNISEMSEEFSVDVSWVDGGSKNKRKRKRNYPRRLLYKRADDNNDNNNNDNNNNDDKPIELNKKLSLDFLFDKKTGKTTKPDIPLIDLGQDNTGEGLLCANCFVNGEATISMKLGGKFDPLFKLTDASISVNGNIRVNLDLTVNGQVKTSVSPPEIEIFNTPLSPLGVQNLFNIGPSLILAASSKISADITGSVHTGGEISLPNFNANASFVDKPTFVQSGFEPQTKPVDPTAGIKVSTDISGSLKPQLAFGLSILNGLFTVKTGFQIVTTVDANISVGNENGCNQNLQPRIKSSVNGDLGFFVEDKSFPIVDFPSLDLLNQCVPISSPNKS